MLSLLKLLIVALLTILCFVCIRSLLLVWIGDIAAKSKLAYLQRERWSYRLAQSVARNPALYRHLADLLESVRLNVAMSSFLLLTSALGLCGMISGGIFLGSLKGMLALGFMSSAFPYVMLRIRLTGLQMKARLEFLPAVEVIYQCYLVNGSKNPRNALKNALEQNRLTEPIKQIIELLYRNLLTHRDPDDCLRIFAMSLGHTWADYFVGILRVGLLEGHDMSGSLKELIRDMRQAQRADQAERNRLLEIRIANFTPLLFLGLFIFINFQINAQSAYYYYVVDLAGRNMLVDALLLIFASFLMGIYLSMKRI